MPISCPVKHFEYLTTEHSIIDVTLMFSQDETKVLIVRLALSLQIGHVKEAVR